MKSFVRKLCAGLVCACGMSVSVYATDYYVATDGNDMNVGSIEKPFATLSKALKLVQPGDNIYLRGGEYNVTEDWIMDKSGNKTYAKVFDIKQKGNPSSPICVIGYKNERPVLNMEQIKLTDRRVAVFYIAGSYWRFKNFEVVGTQVAIKGHTQSEVFRIEGGNNNILENIDVHDGMAIGFYLVKGMNNLVLNCDAHDNYDGYSEGDSGNVDGFGGHANKETSTGNIFRGCRAWNNGDDGFDLINCYASYIIEYCWSFRNGYKPHSIESSGGNGAGFKSGGYGMGDIKKVPNPIPYHTVRYCLAYYNRQQGFYSNHHLGGLIFENNTAYKNPSNYNMLNRKSSNEAVDVPGYGHIIKNNLSLSPRNSGGFPQHLINVDNTLSEIKNNSFAPNDLNLSESDFESLNEQELMGSRKSDGSLPDINFLRLTNHANFRFSGMGCFINEEAVDYSWIQEPAIVLENGVARIVGENSKSFNKFYVNGEEVSIENGIVDLTSMSGELNLKAISENGAVTTLIINK